MTAPWASPSPREVYAAGRLAGLTWASVDAWQHVRRDEPEPRRWWQTPPQAHAAPQSAPGRTEPGHPYPGKGSRMPTP